MLYGYISSLDLELHGRLDAFLINQYTIYWLIYKCALRV